MLGLADRAEAILASDPQAVHARDSHGRSALDAATLLDNHRGCSAVLHAGHDKTAAILIMHGAAIELEHAASLGRLDRIREIVQRDPEALTRPRTIQALIGGAAMRDSPLRAAQPGPD